MFVIIIQVTWNVTEAGELNPEGGVAGVGLSAGLTVLTSKSFVLSIKIRHQSDI